VVDSNDVDRISEVAETLQETLQYDDLKNASVLILANKQDLPQAASASQLVDRLRLHNVQQDWYIQASCGTTGDGLYDGLDWLAKSVRSKRTAQN
jgi:ADP-ribosylation factor 1/2